MSKLAWAFAIITVLAFTILIAVTWGGSAGATFAQTMLLPITIFMTAVVTWFVNENLDRPRIRVNIIKTEFQEAKTGSFTILHLFGLMQFLGEPLEFVRTIASHFGDTLSETDLSHLFNLGKNPELTPSPQGAAVAFKGLTFYDIVTRKVDYDIRAIEDAITKAKDGITKINNINSELSMFLIKYPQPTDSEKDFYIDMFDKLVVAQMVSQQFKPDTNAPANEWHQLLNQIHVNLRVTSQTIDTAIQNVEREKAKAIEKAQGSHKLIVTVMAVNTGNSSSGLLNVALLEVTSKVRSQLILTSDCELDHLIIPAKQHLVIEFCAQKSDESSSTSEWQKATDQYKSAAATCRVKLRTITGANAVSKDYPFYTSDAFRTLVLEALKAAK